MKYLGSKNRIAKEIIKVMLKYRKPNQWWVEPFVGGANVIDKISGKRMGADTNEYIIALLNEMSKPDFKAPRISEYEYINVSLNKDNYPDWYVGYVGTQLTWGAKWFAGYARCKRDRNRSTESMNSVNKQSKNLNGIKFFNCSYE